MFVFCLVRDERRGECRYGLRSGSSEGCDGDVTRGTVRPLRPGNDRLQTMLACRRGFGPDAINTNTASFVARHPDLIAVLFRHCRPSIRASVEPMQDHGLNHALRVG